MRMWNVDPKYMCRQHLLGEHVEMHMFVGIIIKGTSLEGYIRGGLVEVHNIQKRHDELVVEMLRRGYKHHSPLPDSYKLKLIAGKVDGKWNEVELTKRCLGCRLEVQKYV